MRKTSTCWGIVFVVAFVLGGETLRAEDLQVNVAALAAIKLLVPENPAEKTYLGLTKSGEFSVRDIDADVVIIEVFSMYCPICQGEAPKVNEPAQAHRALS
jgi:protein-disulfide isomerase